MALQTQLWIVYPFRHISRFSDIKIKYMWHCNFTIFAEIPVVCFQVSLAAWSLPVWREFHASWRHSVPVFLHLENSVESRIAQPRRPRTSRNVSHASVDASHLAGQAFTSSDLLQRLTVQIPRRKGHDKWPAVWTNCKRLAFSAITNRITIQTPFHRNCDQWFGFETVL